jgi:hypothetical protein
MLGTVREGPGRKVPTRFAAIAAIDSEEHAWPQANRWHVPALRGDPPINPVRERPRPKVPA